MGGLIEVVYRTYKVLGAVGVCVVLGGFVAVVVIHSALKKDGR